MVPGCNARLSSTDMRQLPRAQCNSNEKIGTVIFLMISVYRAITCRNRPQIQILDSFYAGFGHLNTNRIPNFVIVSRWMRYSNTEVIELHRICVPLLMFEADRAVCWFNIRGQAIGYVDCLHHWDKLGKSKNLKQWTFHEASF